jgi:hypothetical protein
MRSKRRLSLEEQFLLRRQRDFNEIWEEQPRLTPRQHQVGVLRSRLRRTGKRRYDQQARFNRY